MARKKKSETMRRHEPESLDEIARQLQEFADHVKALAGVVRDVGLDGVDIPYGWSLDEGFRNFQTWRSAAASAVADALRSSVSGNHRETPKPSVKPLKRGK